MPANDSASPLLPEINSLDELSLDRLPVAHAALRKARIVKNSRLKSVIELYRDRSTGSGHYEVSDLPAMLGIPSAHADILLLRWVAMLPTFDIASVRLLLRDVGALTEKDVPLPDDAAIHQYIAPVLRCATEDGTALSRAELDAALMDPNGRGREIMQRLMQLVALRPDETVRFVRDSIDTYAAFGLYARALKEQRRRITQLLDAVRSLAAEPQVRKDKMMLTALAEIPATFPELLSAAERRVGAAEKVIAMSWEKSAGAPLRAHQRQIREVQVLVGYLLAGIEAKLNAWRAAFPPEIQGNVAKRVNFLSLEMAQGLGELRDAGARGTRSSSFPMAVLQIGEADRGEGFRAFLRAREQRDAT